MPRVSNRAGVQAAPKAYFRLLVPALFAGLTLLAVAWAQDHAAHSTTIAAQDYSFEGPAVLAPGWQTIVLRNDGTEMHHLQFARLKDGVPAAQFFAALKSQGEAAIGLTTLVGGVGMIPPGESADALVDFTRPGTYVLLCFLPNEEGVPHLALGMTDVIEVAGERMATAEPTADYEVHMSDFKYSMPSNVTTGEHTWKVVNDGPQFHEMIFVKLNEGVTFEQFTQTLEEQGEAAMPGVPIGGVQGLTPMLASYVTYDLEPGEYVALCGIPDEETGLPHLALGMIAGFTVEEAQAGN